MCHGKAVAAFPEPKLGRAFEKQVSGYYYPAEHGQANAKIAILPDIYGCNPFYQGLSLHLQGKGAAVYLVDTFAGLGELPEVTREAAFARRNKVRDKQFLNDFEAFCAEKKVTGVIGFCLGGLYVFELARRQMRADLIGLYGFPQGLANQDPLPAPFDYLTKGGLSPFTMLMGADDQSVGVDNIRKLRAMAGEVPAMTLKVYDGASHDFLPQLDSDDPAKRAAAVDALAILERAVW